MTPKTFAAVEIARASGFTRQTIHARLAEKETAFSELPIEWQAEITRRAVARGYDNGEAFIENLPAPWRCPIPWAEVSSTHQAKAVKLQKALARALEASGTGTKGAELEAIGMEDYRSVFGYP